MKTEGLKTGFWGYQKFSVYQHITALEAQFSAKLLEQEEEYRGQLEQERQRSLQLEEELQALRQKYEEQRSEQLLIANTLVEAQRCAELLKTQAEEREAQARQQLEEALNRREEDLKQYDARIQRLRELFRSLLQEMDDSAEQLVVDLTEVRESAPDRNMSLFYRKPELVV